MDKLNQYRLLIEELLNRYGEIQLSYGEYSADRIYRINAIVGWAPPTNCATNFDSGSYLYYRAKRAIASQCTIFPGGRSHIAEQAIAPVPANIE